MRHRIGAAVAVAAFLLAAASAPATAETVLAPYVGSTFGGGATDDFGDANHLVYGGTLSFLGEGPLGFEIDGQYSPHFFGGADGSNVESLMGELTIGGGPSKGTRFFVAAGAGILKSRVRDQSDFVDADRNSFGIELGGSLVVPVGSSIGIKGDLRYFRALTNVDAENAGEIDLGGFHFWRASAGVAIRL